MTHWTQKMRRKRLTTAFQSSRGGKTMIILDIIVGGTIIFAVGCLVGRFIRAGGAWDD